MLPTLTYHIILMKSHTCSFCRFCKTSLLMRSTKRCMSLWIWATQQYQFYGPMTVMRKVQLRRELRKERNRLPFAVRQGHDQAILQSLVDWARLTSAHRVMAFLSFGTEINTWSIVDYLLEGGKQV